MSQRQKEKFKQKWGFKRYDKYRRALAQEFYNILHQAINEGCEGEINFTLNLEFTDNSKYLLIGTCTDNDSQETYELDGLPKYYRITLKKIKKIIKKGE